MSAREDARPTGRRCKKSLCPLCFFVVIHFSSETADLLHLQADRRTGVGAARPPCVRATGSRAKCRMRGSRSSRTRPTSSFTRAASWWCRGRARRNSSSSCWSRRFSSRRKLGYETVLNPELLLPRIGVDESGKGDFFGPLCIAGRLCQRKRHQGVEGRRHPRFQEHFQRQKNLRAGRKNPQDARLRGEHRRRLATRPTTGFTRR